MRIEIARRLWTHELCGKFRRPWKLPELNSSRRRRGRDQESASRLRRDKRKGEPLRRNSWLIKTAFRQSRATVCLEKLSEFLYGEARPSDDRPKRSGFEVSPRMNRHCHRSRRVAGIDQDVMTADNPIDYKSSLGERADDLLTSDNR